MCMKLVIWYQNILISCSKENNVKRTNWGHLTQDKDMNKSICEIVYFQLCNYRSMLCELVKNYRSRKICNFWHDWLLFYQKWEEAYGLACVWDWTLLAVLGSVCYIFYCMMWIGSIAFWPILLLFMFGCVWMKNFKNS